MDLSLTASTLFYLTIFLLPVTFTNQFLARGVLSFRIEKDIQPAGWIDYFQFLRNLYLGQRY